MLMHASRVFLQQVQGIRIAPFPFTGRTILAFLFLRAGMRGDLFLLRATLDFMVCVSDALAVSRQRYRHLAVISAGGLEIMYEIGSPTCDWALPWKASLGSFKSPVPLGAEPPKCHSSQWNLGALGA